MDRLQSMTLFARVVERGSFSEVAKEYGLTQPTVSKCISALEKRLSAPLFDRSTRHVRATEAGRGYYHQCRRIIEAVTRAEENVAGLHARPGGTFRISVPISFGRLYMVNRVVAFLRRFPDIDVRLDMNDHPVEIVREGYDVAIRTGRLDDSSLVARKIGRNHRVMVATPDYLAAHGTPRSPADLERHNCVRTADKWVLQGPRGEVRVGARGNLTVNNAEAVREAVLAHLGIGIVPLWSVHGEIRRGALNLVLARYAPAGKDIYAVYPLSRRPSATLRAFIEFVAEDLRRTSYLPHASAAERAQASSGSFTTRRSRRKSSQTS